MKFEDFRSVETWKKMEVLVTTLLYFVLFLVLYSSTKKLLEKINNLPPSPLFTLPLIGHLHLMKNPPHKQLCLLSKKYGPVFSLMLGSRRLLVISSASAAEDCFSKNDIVFANRPRLFMGKHLGYDYTSIEWASYGDHWRNLRRISSVELLSSHRIDSLSHIRLDCIRALLHHLFSLSSENSGKNIVDLKSSIFELVFNVLTRIIVGKRFYGQNVVSSEEAREFEDIIHEVSNASYESTLGDFIPLLRRFDNKAGERLKAIHERRDKFFQNLIDGIRGRGPRQPASSSDKGKSIIELLLSLQESDPEIYTDEYIKSFISIFLQGGSETSVSTMEWAMTLLLHNQAALEKVQAEIDSHVGHDRLIDDSDVAQLPYLKCVIKETLRLFPVAPLLVPHESSEESTVGGFRVPRGTMLFVNVWALHRDPAIWEDPLLFKPERFMAKEGTKEDFKHMPFGKGRRGCPGEPLAMRMIGLALGSLVQCFHWQSVTTEKEDLVDSNGIFVTKSKPLLATCSPRPTTMHLLSQSSK